MDATWSVGLTWSYFFHHDYLVFQCQVHAMFLFPYSITQTRPCAYCFLSSFQCVGYMQEGIICNCIMAVLDHSDAMQSIVVTTYPAL